MRICVTGSPLIRNGLTVFHWRRPGFFSIIRKTGLLKKPKRCCANSAESAQLAEQIEHLFTGTPINNSENRPALHTALRQQNDTPIIAAGQNIITEIRTSQEKMRQFTTAITAGQWLGFTGRKITDIVNIGIGGSELGPALAIAALKPYANPSLHCHFISNIDGSPLHDLLRQLNPQTTLFIVSSKSFTTQETLCNAETAKTWLLAASGNNPQTLQQHFIAITAKSERAMAFGITAENIFPLWDWVGGRYSLWSTIGLPIMLAIGSNNFQELLAGANAMDQHFRTAPFNKNMPVLLALLSIWYVNFFQAHSHALLPYDYHLQLFPAYMQQLHMESHGKQVRQDGTL